MQTGLERSFRLSGAVLVFVAALMTLAPQALCAPNGDTVAYKDVWDMPPSAIAKLAHADGKAWVERTIYTNVPLGHDLGGMVLYAMPEPATGRLCRVDALSISTDRVDEMQYRLTRGSELVFFTIAQGFDGMAGVPSGAALAGACHRTPVKSDIYVHAGAENLFSAPSPEIAVDATDAVTALSNAVPQSTGPLPFDLSCEGSNSIAHFCADTRSALAKALERKLEEVDRCAGAADTCLDLRGFQDGHDRCRLRIDFQGKDLAVVDRVRMSCDVEPFF